MVLICDGREADNLPVIQDEQYVEVLKVLEAFLALDVYEDPAIYYW